MSRTVTLASLRRRAAKRNAMYINAFCVCAMAIGIACAAIPVVIALS